MKRIRPASEFVVFSISAIFWLGIAIITIIIWAPWPTPRRDEHDEARLD